MEAIQEFLTTYPFVGLIPILVLGAALGIIVIERLLAWRANQPGPVASAVIDYLITMAADALEYIAAKLGDLTPELRSQKVVEIARSLYTLIPPYVVVSVRGRPITVPVRWLISEDLFVQLVIALASGAADRVDVIRRQIKERYRQYRQDPAAISLDAIVAGDPS